MLLKNIPTVFPVPFNREPGSTDSDGSVSHPAVILPQSVRSLRRQFIEKQQMAHFIWLFFHTADKSFS